MKLNQLTFATLATLLLTGSIVAQQTPTTQPQAAPAQIVKSGQPIQTQTPSGSLTQKPAADASQSKEQAFAKCLAISNQEQVMLAKFAKDKSTSDDVKAFATTLEKAHQGCLDELKVLASKTVSNRPINNENPSNLANNNTSTIDFLQMHQEMSDQCLKDSKEMLSKKEGVEFDKCFVGMQVAKHAMAHSSLTVLQRHTTGELQTFVKEGLTKNAEHMKASITLMEQLSDKIETRTSKKTE